MTAALAIDTARDSLDVRPVTRAGAAAVKSFIAASPGGSVFHHSGWANAARAAYGYEDVSLAAFRGDAIVGVLPLIDVRAPFLGRSLVSTAFSVGGGPLADDGDALAALLDGAEALGRERRANYIEIRDNVGGEEWTPVTDVYASFELPIPEDEGENLAAIPRKRRAEVRKAIKFAQSGDLAIRLSRDPDEFYRLYAASLRDHGTPVFPKVFLETLIASFGDAIEISIAEYRGEAVGALMSFYDRDVVRPYYIGASAAARHVRAADFLYWTQMRRAAEKGCRRFDFGRSKIGTGPYQFKTLWGAAPAPLVYRRKLIAARRHPDVNPNSPKFAAFVAAWRRLPYPLANRFGPFLAGNFA